MSARANAAREVFGQYPSKFQAVGAPCVRNSSSMKEEAGGSQRPTAPRAARENRAVR